MSVEQLKDVLKLNLEQRGVLNKIKASLRAEIYKAFEEGEDEEVKSRRPPITGQQLVINELIRDYFEWCGYGNALSVFLQESGQPQEPLERRFLVSELGLQNMRPKEQTLYVRLLIILHTDSEDFNLTDYLQTVIIYGCFLTQANQGAKTKSEYNATRQQRSTSRTAIPTGVHRRV